MSEQGFYGKQVCTVLIQMGAKGVAQGMAGR